MRHYPQLASILAFGRQLVVSGDLDPIYLALNHAGYDRAQRARWLVAYLAFYHAGVASWASAFADEAFWDALTAAVHETAPPARVGRWPRGHERRHFRGAAALQALAEWRARYGDPAAMFEFIATGGPADFAAVAGRAQTHRLIGPWLAFKCVDLVDACWGVEIDQSDAAPFLYAKPVAGLRRAYPAWPPLTAVEFIQAELADLRVPHHPARPLDLFAIETIACKWGSHLSGHYPLHNDLDEITTGLQPWTEIAPAAAAFAAAMPPRPVDEWALI